MRAVIGVAGPTVPAPATTAVMVTVPAKLLRLWMLATVETGALTFWLSTSLGIAATEKSGGGTVIATETEWTSDPLVPVTVTV
jgi:hypothetical protein